MGETATGVKNTVIGEALEMLRSEGVRIPLKFRLKLLRQQDFQLSKADAKKIEVALKESGSGKWIIMTLKKGKLVVHRYDSYLSLLNCADNARKHKTQNGHGKELFDEKVTA